MKILLVNKYLYPKGGDAVVTLATGELLRKNGHSIFFWGMDHPLNPDYKWKQYFVSNSDYNINNGFLQKIRMSFNILYSLEASGKIEKLILSEKPDIVHLHNFAHQISPSILNVLKKYNIPSVMTMHDYKLVCPVYSMLSHGMICEKCANQKYYKCFLNKCTKDSYMKSFINMSEMYLHHKILKVYDGINMFISPSRFMQEKLVKMGFKGKIEYLPNFIRVRDQNSRQYSENNVFFYFGRLSREKGIITMIDAIKNTNAVLRVAGSGPLDGLLKEKIRLENINNVHLLGYKMGDELEKEIKSSIAVILPSEVYENNPRSILESFALGRPAIGARMGGIPELIIEGETGWTFTSGDVEGLRSKIIYCLNNKASVEEAGVKAREYVESNFNEEKHYLKLIDIYQKAILRSKWYLYER